MKSQISLFVLTLALIINPAQAGGPVEHCITIDSINLVTTSIPAKTGQNFLPITLDHETLRCPGLNSNGPRSKVQYLALNIPRNVIENQAWEHVEIITFDHRGQINYQRRMFLGDLFSNQNMRPLFSLNTKRIQMRFVNFKTLTLNL